MRKVLLTLLAVLSLSAVAQKSRQYTFDFSQPATLIPAPSLVENGGTLSNYIPVSEFYSPDRAVYLKFVETSTGGGLGAAISTNERNGVLTYKLEIPRGVQMLVKGNDVELDSLVFSEFSFTGGLFFNSPRGVGVTSPFGNWYGQGARNVYEIQYVQNGHNPTIYAFTVYYTEPQNTLKAVSPLETATYKTRSLRQFVLTYDKAVKLTDSPSFTLTSSSYTFESPALTATVNPTNPKQVIVALSDGTAFEEVGDYNLIVGENSVVTDDDDAYYNPRTVYKITILPSYNTFDMLAVNPDTGVVEQIPNHIELTFPGIARFRENPLNDIFRLVNENGTTTRRVKLIHADAEDYSKVTLEFQDGLDGAVTTPGIYTLTIPEGVIWNSEYAPEKTDSGIADGARYNPDIELVYNIGDLKYASEEKLAEARQWLAKTGAGYPAADSKSRLILQAMVNRRIGTDEKFTDSIAAYIAETAIELPATGKYYRISAESADGTPVYLATRNDSIVLTTDINEAVSLKATVNDDQSVTFSTIDGLYLHQLQSSDKYTGTTQRNATSAYDAAVNNLTLAHLSVEGVTPEAAFGLVTIFGSLGQNINSDEKTAYALVDVTKPSVETDWEAAPRFTGTLTSAFRLEQTEKPVPVLDYTLTPAAGTNVDTIQYVKVTFNTDLPVSLVANASATLTRANGVSLTSAAIKAVEGETNTFEIRFDDVPAGNCTVTIPEGTFTFVDEGRTLNTQAITASYYVYYTMDFQYDLQEQMQFYVIGANLGLEYVHDVDMNNFALYVPQPYTFGISSQKAELVQLINGTEKHIVNGHFEQIANFAQPGFEGCGAIRLVYDTPITTGSIEPGEYMIKVYQGTFGDTNYAKYLADPTSVSKRQCHVNSYAFYVVLVNNEKADTQHKVYPSEETLAKAKALLNKTGVGYPKATSTARKALQELVNKGEGTNAVFLSAINTFLTDSDIELPATGKYYKVEAVSPAGSLFLLSADSKLQLTAAATEATPFKLTSLMQMCTIDGLYIDLNKKDGLLNPSEELTVGPAMTFTRQTAEGIDAEATFGLMCFSQALVNMSAQTIVKSAELAYSASLTTYFRLTEVDESEVILPQPELALTPAAGSSVETLEKITVTFNTNGTIRLADPTKVKLSAAGVGVLYTNPLTIRLEDNVLTMTYINMPSATYTLTIDEGAFTVDYGNGRTSVLEAYTADITVTDGVRFKVADYSSALSWLEDPKGELVMDTYMNTFTLVSQTELSVDRFKDVELLYNDTQVSTARFAAAVPNSDGSYSYKLKFYVTPGSCPKGTFQVIVPEGTFGDATFGNYLDAPRQVLKSDCQVNAALVFTATVDNDYVTGIREVSVAGDATVVYDLQGRRVSGQLVPGRTYIRGGRKFTVGKR